MAHTTLSNNKKSVSRKPQEVKTSIAKRATTPVRVTKKNQIITKATTLRSHAAVRSGRQVLEAKVTTKKVGQKVFVKKMKRSMKKGLKVALLSPVFHTVFRVTTTAVVVVALLYTSYTYISKSFANEVVVSQSEIIARVGQLTSLPNDEEPDQVVRVQDESSLRHQNPFYQDVKEGDYIIMYKHLAVIYDFRNDVIVALKRTK